MPRISRTGSGPGLRAFKGEFAAVHKRAANPNPSFTARFFMLLGSRLPEEREHPLRISITG
jgi:hypothetical protein